MTRRLFAAFGRSVYPAPGASGRSRRVGRTPWRRCRQCGTPNDTRKTGWGDGDAISHDSDGDPTVDGGCVFCGTLSWTKSKPTPVEDGSQTLPSLEWRRKRR